MARSAKLKVYRTPIGFHDAYVAATSQKAALEAWGSDHDLFGRGEAELVTDAALIRAPLGQPGVVIKVLRGSAAEQFAALDAGAPARKGMKAKAAPTRAAAPPAPRPSRAALDQTEQAIDAAEKRHRQEVAAIARKDAKLQAERRALEDKQRDEIERLKTARDDAAANHDAALERWRG